MIKKQWQKALYDKALKTVKSHGQLTRSIALFSLIISQIYVSNSLCSLSNKAKNSLCLPHSRYICWERLLLLIPWDYSAMFTHWVGTQTENSNFHLCTSMRCKPNISESLRNSSQIFRQLPFPNLKTLPLLINLFLFSLLSVASAFNQMFHWTSFFYFSLCFIMLTNPINVFGTHTLVGVFILLLALSFIQNVSKSLKYF